MENKIYGAIVATMKDIGAIGKNDTNKFDNYKFRGIDAVYNALQPAMIKNGIFVIPNLIEIVQTDRLSRKGESMIHTRVEVEYSFYADDGSCVKATVPGEAMDRSDKSANKAMSAAYKYACFQTFSIPTEDFSDADTESPEAGTTAPVQKTPKPKQKKKDSLTPRDLLLAYIEESGRNSKDVAAEYGLTPNTTDERFHEVHSILMDIDIQEKDNGEI